MAPSRKKGANSKTKTANELRLGDLVLAKVKGFPAWPAKVSRPEDWERAPDPKKYFVQFFGTQEIAFVAPPDVQAFTSESKSKLLARCKGKTVKYFAQAVKEICEVFEELKKSDIGAPGDNAAAPKHDDEDGNVNGSHAKFSRRPKSETQCASDSVLDHTSGLRGCFSMEDLLKQAATAEEKQELKKSIDYSEMHNRVIDTGRDLSVEASVPSSLDHSLVKDETGLSENKADTVARHERIESSRASSSSPYSGRSEVKRVTSHHGDGKKDTPMPVGASDRKFSSGGEKKPANGHRSRELISGAKRKLDGVLRHTEDAKSGVFVKDLTPGKLSASGHAKRLSSGLNKLESSPHGKALQNLFKDQKLLDVGRSSPRDAVADFEDRGNGEYSRQKDRETVQEQSQSVKKAKHVHIASEGAKGSIIKNEKSDLEPEIYSEEAVTYVSKSHRRALETTSDVKIGSEDKRSFGLRTLKSDFPKKRRAVCLYNDDDDDNNDPKTPVHGGSSSAFKVGLPATDAMKKNAENRESFSCVAENRKVSSRDGGGSQKNCLPSVKLVGESSVPATLQRKVDNSTTRPMSQSPVKEELDKRLFREAKTDLVSPAKSPLVADAAKRLADFQKLNKLSIKGTSFNSYSKVQIVPGKDSNFVSGGSNSSQGQLSSQKSKQPLSGERAKSIPKISMRLNGPASSLDNQKDHDPALVDERMEDAKDRSGDLKGLDSALSMKHLIAAAQAKRRQAHIQNVPLGNGNSLLAPTANLHGKSPSPLSRGHDSSSGMGNVTELDELGAHHLGSLASPPLHIRQLASHNQLDSEEHEYKEPGSGHHAVGSTLSGGTEAAVARDAFEGMIETLSRTKESIGRATRLAIDCAKYGIANEVVELLIHKLESEPNFHRRVDLFFLVDSITQCSHSQKGIAGASYIPIVQASLPRLLGAAAPSGSSARENRRQCLKVLRLWLERKILPESVLRRFMDDIGSSNDDIPFRRPSRAERSVDDPIREMEGMLVDEYGSNATFNMTGFLSTHGFVDDDEDEEDVPCTSFRESDASPLQSLSNLAGLEPGKDTPNDRHHHILEEVDGELEMEDVSGHLKDGALLPSGSSKKVKQEMPLDTQLESSIDDVVESPFLEGSPPLPLESPPPLPPLPSSPPPPPPPPSSPSPPPPPPPPPPMLPSQPPPLSSVSSVPPHAGNVQPLLPPQSSMAPQVLLLPSSVVPPVQAPLPPDYSVPTGSHPNLIAGNTPQQVPCFPAGASGSHDTPGYSSVYVGPQAVQSNQQFQQNQQFQPRQATYVQTAFPPVTLPQPPSVHFAYNKPTVQPQMPQSRPHPPPHPAPSHPYSSASHSESLRRFGDEQWRSASAEYKADSQHNLWMNGGRMPSCPSANFTGEAYFRPERPLIDSMGYQQISAPNPAMAAPSTSGHGINQMLPSRPDMPSLNCWRPV